MDHLLVCHSQMNADFIPSVLNGKDCLQRCYWLDSKHFVLQRRQISMPNTEMVFTRSVEMGADGQPELLLKSVFRDLSNGNEISATSWFGKVGDSPNSPPVTDPSLKMLLEKPGSVDAAPEAAAGTLPTDSRMRTESKMSDDHLDDSAAFNKSRAKSVASKKRKDATLQHASLSATTSGIDARMSGNGNQKPDFSGAWQRWESSGAPTAASLMSQKTAHVHLITMTRSDIRIQELVGGIGGRVLDEISLTIDGAFCNSVVVGKLALTRCFWEGSTLVVHRKFEESGREVFLRRDLETEKSVNRDGESTPTTAAASSGGSSDAADRMVVRLVTKEVNMVTGEEQDSMSFFYEIPNA
jgi:hypothetical protein